jgi:hypothetical protein
MLDRPLQIDIRHAEHEPDGGTTGERPPKRCHGAVTVSAHRRAEHAEVVGSQL